MNVKKRLLLLSSVGILGIGLTVGGTTFALFTDGAANENSAIAGTIDLQAKRDHGDYVPGPMFYPDYLDPDGNHPYDSSEISPSGEAIGGWAPGDTVQRTMIVTNEGSLDAKITGIKATPRAAYTQSLPSGGSRTVNGLTSGAAFNEFINKANVVVKVPDQSLTLYDGPLSSLIFSDPDQYEPTLVSPVMTGTVPPFQPGPVNITFEVTPDKSAGNDIQGQNFIFDFGFYAEQDRNN